MGKELYPIYGVICDRIENEKYELNPTPQNVPDMYKDAIMDSINGGF